jgi:transposase
VLIRIHPTRILSFGIEEPPREPPNRKTAGWQLESGRRSGRGRRSGARTSPNGALPAGKALPHVVEVKQARHEGVVPQLLLAAVNKERNTVERCISKLKQFRTVATCYDKRDFMYQATIDVASIRIWLRDPVMIYGTRPLANGRDVG